MNQICQEIPEQRDGKHKSHIDIVFYLLASGYKLTRHWLGCLSLTGGPRNCLGLSLTGAKESLLLFLIIFPDVFQRNT